jgi:hypothetical protein
MKIEINNKTEEQGLLKNANNKHSKDCSTNEIIEAYLRNIPKEEETREQIMKRMNHFSCGW